MDFAGDITVLDPVDLPPKMPYDEVPYQLDFGPALPDGDTIASIVGTVIGLYSDDPGNETDISAMHIGAPVSSGTVAQQVTGGGTTRTYYKLRVRVIGVSGIKLERCGRFYVLDR